MMQKIFRSLILLLCAANFSYAGTPDSVYICAYGNAGNMGRGGLHFAWSADKTSWANIGNDYAFVYSDYGRWGLEKRMVAPYIIQNANGEYDCVWQLNEYEPVFAHVATKDFVYWGRQSYPAVSTGSNCFEPKVSYNKATKQYAVTYRSGGKFYSMLTPDFKSYTPALEVSPASYIDSSATIFINGVAEKGQVHKVAWPVVEKMINSWKLEAYERIKSAEATAQDATRFAELKPVDVHIAIEAGKQKPISDMLLGIFFEDINYAADGGLYAELIQNRDFEYDLSDKEGHDSSWNHKHSWHVTAPGTSFTIDSTAPIHENNRHYAVLKTTTTGASFVNHGYDSIHIQKGESYNFSLFVKSMAGKATMRIKLVSNTKGILAQTTINSTAASWKKIKTTLVANAGATDAALSIEPLQAGTIAVDMVSLFPQKTFKNRPNGLRNDLAQTIADIHPRFVRFPGGCVAHGDGLGNIYRWKNTIGALEARKPQKNLWGYHQSAGLGYFEFFRFCEDIGAAPLPVIAAGVPCQNSATGGGGQQCGVPMSEMNDYVQDILDLVEYANGDAKTPWGSKRAAAGHPSPFNLKYIGIGNEDLITDVFEERYTMIVKAMRAKHPEITIIGTVGPTWQGTDYTEGWQLAEKLSLPMVDEHYYQPPGWFINNQDYYDKYDRTKSKVYLGEYAAHLPGRPNNLETALAEALYLTALEKNGDVVSMASYAPLLAKNGHTQWDPNLIYFNNDTVKPTVGYQVQKLYGNNAGNQYLNTVININNPQDAVKKRIAVSVTTDTVLHRAIIKLVNLLPVAANANIDLSAIQLAGESAVKTVLTGAPADKLVTPVVSQINVANQLAETLPPYSFTIISVKIK